jgi:hypothetical protein
VDEDPFDGQLGEGWQRVDGLIAAEKSRVYIRAEPDSNGRKLIVGMHVDGTPVTSDLLRSLPIGRIETALNGDPIAVEQFLAELQPLTRRRGQDPDEFAALVAAYYNAFAMISPKPVKKLAEHAKIPLPTAHGWVREARLRGKLPKGQRGKATAG